MWMSDTMRPCQYKIYFKLDIEGCTVNKSDDAAWHMLYIMSTLSPTILSCSCDIKLQVQYEDVFQGTYLKFHLG